ncbi:TPA: CvpA family protein [Legionella pneumophila subsp. pneumophila]|uniref:Colicin V n=1 Tax=Legionella pneumophila (strain Lens) TaxID=297245 RepID=Q5WX02_LEGPL|nr:CvpA family protein [Legionella pneumophila]AOW52107.1 colicin V synthesis protein [Legionella pneumophila subsp. pneumophila]AOW57404.1 colicin V synthesis protein [Legionella pneumophila subsp. pneumophila]AOW59670.1 colicin V synthesis protein [Legionella pneumophila subsp. pneumophila]AOW62902.1 colicin V synthesis protein [Legionella pneumophila subsp. pneumophila]AOW67817.1 colicin V synthesis protein [Legionella pneumophila subsp. pneumophila]
MQLQWVDIAIVAIIALSVLTGLFRGFVKELVALCVWILAIWLGFSYSQSLDPWLSSYIEEQSVRTAIGFIIILFATLFVGGVVNAILSFILKRAGLSGTDRTLGMGFGFLRGVFIVALIMVAVKMTSLPYQEYSQKSKLYARFDPVVALLYSHLPEFIKQVKTVDKTENIIDTVPAS